MAVHDPMAENDAQFEQRAKEPAQLEEAAHPQGLQLLGLGVTVALLRLFHLSRLVAIHGHAGGIPSLPWPTLLRRAAPMAHRLDCLTLGTMPESLWAIYKVSVSMKKGLWPGDFDGP